MKKSKEIRIEDYRKISEQIDDLYRIGEDAKGEKLLYEALAKAAGDEAYRLFFEGEVAGYVEKDAEKQESLFRQAIKHEQEDYFLMRCLGTVLGNQGKHDEAIEWYKKALSVNEKDYKSIGGIGVNFGNQGKHDEALEWYEKAISVNEKDFLTYRNWSILLNNRGEFEGALEKIKEAYKLAPENKDVRDVLQFICKYLDKDVNEVIKELTGEGVAPKIEQGVPELRALVEKVQKKFGSKIEDFAKKMEEEEERLNDFLKHETSIKEGLSFLFILRKWNSYTPAIPTGDEERSLGGGYFIYHNGEGTVIDPGYNFIENFYKAGCRITDIDNIVITHAHNDHTNDFESLMTLIYKYNGTNGFKPESSEYKKIKVYINTGALFKFSGIIDLRGCDYIDYVFTMTPGSSYEVTKGMTLTVLDAYHDELVSKKYSVGLHFSIMVKNDKKQNVERRILFTSDTGLFPKKRVDGKDVADTEGQEIHERYGEFKDNINLLIPHLGSIKEKEIRSKIDSPEVYYPNHLGILGTVRMITEIKPKLAVVSEFGEELKAFRRELIDLLCQVVTGFFKSEPEDAPIVLPGDTPFIYDIKKEEICCTSTRKMVHFSNIEYFLAKHDRSFYYYSRDKEVKLGMQEAHCKFFNSQREGRECPYVNC